MYVVQWWLVNLRRWFARIDVSEISEHNNRWDTTSFFRELKRMILFCFRSDDSNEEHRCVELQISVSSLIQLMKIYKTLGDVDLGRQYYLRCCRQNSDQTE